MSQHGYMRHMATPPFVLEMGQKLWHEASIYPTGLVVYLMQNVRLIRGCPHQSFSHG